MTNERRRAGAFGNLLGAASSEPPTAVEDLAAIQRDLVATAARAVAALSGHEVLAVTGAHLRDRSFDTAAEIVSRLDPSAGPEDIIGLLVDIWSDETLVSLLRSKIGHGRLKALALRQPVKERGAPKVHPGSNLALLWLVKITMKAGSLDLQPACKLIAECAIEFGGVWLDRSPPGAARQMRSYEAIRAAYNRALSGEGATLSQETAGFERLVDKEASRLSGDGEALRAWLRKMLRAWSRRSRP